MRLEDAFDHLQSSRPLLNNAQKNLNAARAIVELDEPDARASAAASFAQQIVHVYGALTLPEKEMR
jgi:exonuclease VII small subunit